MLAIIHWTPWQFYVTVIATVGTLAIGAYLMASIGEWVDTMIRRAYDWAYRKIFGE